MNINYESFLPDIENLVEQHNHGALLNILVDIHPADIEEILNHLNKDQRKYLFDLLPTELASEVLVELDTPVADQILEDKSDDEISDLVEEMDSDDAADVISELDDDVAERVLEKMDVKTVDLDLGATLAAFEQGRLDGPTHPLAFRDPLPARRFPNPCVKFVWYQYLQPVTHMSMLTC